LFSSLLLMKVKIQAYTQASVEVRKIISRLTLLPGSKPRLPSLHRRFTWFGRRKPTGSNLYDLSTFGGCLHSATTTIDMTPAAKSDYGESMQYLRDRVNGNQSEAAAREGCLTKRFAAFTIVTTFRQEISETFVI
jgi:hypothetical protein